MNKTLKSVLFAVLATVCLGTTQIAKPDNPAQQIAQPAYSILRFAFGLAKGASACLVGLAIMYVGAGGFGISRKAKKNTKQ